MMLQLLIDILFTVWLSTLTIILILERKRNKKSLNIEIPKNRQLIKAKRYIIFNVITESSDLESSQIEEAIRVSVKELLGKVWLDISNPRVIFFLPDRKEGIISTNRGGYKVVIASLPLTKKVSGTKVLLVPVKTTGSLKKAKEMIGLK